MSDLEQDERGDRFFLALIRHCQQHRLPGITLRYPTLPAQYVTVETLQAIRRRIQDERSSPITATPIRPVW